MTGAVRKAIQAPFKSADPLLQSLLPQIQCNKQRYKRGNEKICHLYFPCLPWIFLYYSTEANTVLELDINQFRTGASTLMSGWEPIFIKGGIP